jgi:hypothetical protein
MRSCHTGDTTGAGTDDIGGGSRCRIFWGASTPFPEIHEIYRQSTFPLAVEGKIPLLDERIKTLTKARPRFHRQCCMAQLLTLAKVEVSSAASLGRIVNFETVKKRFMSTFDMSHDMFVYQTGPRLQEFKSLLSRGTDQTC